MSFDSAKKQKSFTECEAFFIIVFLESEIRNNLILNMIANH